MDFIQSNLTRPTPNSSHSVTDEALNMLETYLQFESLKEAVMMQKLDSFSAAGDWDTSGLQAKHNLNFNILTPLPVGDNSSRKKFGLWDPLTRRRSSLTTSPRPTKSADHHQCALCGKDVTGQHRASRSALSANCSPERQVQFDARNSLPSGCERMLQQDRHKTAEPDRDSAVFALSHLEETSDIDELALPRRVPLIHLPHSDSQSQSACDKMDGIDPFRLQQSSLSTSDIIEPYSLPNSGVPSRTPSQLKTNSFIQTMLGPQGDNQLRSVNRSHSAGINLLQKQVLISPSVRWPSSVGPTSTSSCQYSRCESVHSAPVDGRQRAREKTKRESLRKWFRFSLPKVRKFSKPIDSSRTTDSLSTTPIVSQAGPSESDEKPTVAPKETKASRTHLGLDSLFHLIPRWFRGREDGESPDPYVLGGFTLRLKRSMFGNVPRRRRRKAYNPKHSTVELTNVKRAPRLSPIYIPDRMSGHYGRMKNESTASTTNGTLPCLPSRNSIQNEHAANESVALQPASVVASPTILSEVSRMYGEIIHTAEGGRLGESTVQVWRSVTDKATTEEKSLVAPISHFGDPFIPTARNQPLCSIDELHSATPDRLLRPPKPNHIAAGHTFLIGSDSTTPEPTFVSYSTAWSPSQTSRSKNSDSSGDSPITFSPPPPPEPHESVSHLQQSDERNLSTALSQQNMQNYAVYVAAMIDVLSQRIMNQISEDDLELRLQRLELEATTASLMNDSVRGPENTNKSVVDQQSGSLTCESASERTERMPKIHTTSYRKPSLMVESHTIERVLLAQVRRLEHRNKLDIQIDLLNHLPQHTQYTSFEADMLRLLGKNPSWHHIAILYYLARCTVRHILKTHLTELDALQRSYSDVSGQPRSRSKSSAQMLEELDRIERKFSAAEPGPSELGSLPDTVQEVLLTEIGRCRARVERIKDFTITFFTRWYADWVSKHGGWRSLIEDAEDSELD